MNTLAQNRRNQVVGSLVMTAIILITTYASTSSIDPTEVYESEGIAPKIVVSLCLLLLAASITSLLGQAAVFGWVGKMTGMPAEDVICPGCGQPLLSFISSHGMPIPCGSCKRVWHRGPACYTKGLGPSARVLGVPCPDCRNARADNELRVDPWADAP